MDQQEDWGEEIDCSDVASEQFQLILHNNEHFLDLLSSNEDDGLESLNQTEFMVHQQVQHSFVDDMDDSIMNAMTTNQSQTREVDMLDENVRKKINETLHEGIKNFTQKLFSNTSIKMKEQEKLVSLLKNFKISKDILIKNVQDNSIRQKVRNTTNSFEEHMRSGLPIKFQVCDAINPFYLSFNQTMILIITTENEQNSQLLDNLDSYLRSKYKVIYIKPELSRNGKEILSLTIQFDKGLLKFVIRCGQIGTSIEILQYEMLKTYVAYSTPFQAITAFLLHWADQRGILSDDYLSEIALQCMIIHFLQMNDLVPSIFDQKYCFWDEHKKNYMSQIEGKFTPMQSQILREHFSSEDFVVVPQKGMRRNKTRDIIYQVHFHTFPREGSIKQIREIQAQQKRKPQINQNQSINYGVLVAKFFHMYALDKVQKRQIDITGVNKIPTEQDIGYQVMSPIIPRFCLTKNLSLKQGGRQVLPRAFFAVKEEFQRAYLMITQTKFQELNKKRETFIQ